MLVIAASTTREPEGDETADDVRRWQEEYRSYLASIAARSTRGRGPVVIPESTHVTLISRDGPAAAVAREIAAFAKELRADVAASGPAPEDAGPP